MTNPCPIVGELPLQEMAIDQANAIRAVGDHAGREDDVEQVVVVLSSSRGGSSLFKEVLARHPQISALAGEEEPYYVLTRNGFPWTSKHDGFTEVKNKQALLNNIFDELLEQDWAVIWRNRLALQFPFRNFDHVEMSFECLRRTDVFTYYDGPGGKTPYCRNYRIEEPPFVVPRPPKPLQKTLLFKTPQDAYRIGLFEKLFPKATVKYIHLTRGFAQTVNGLMDGWECDWGFCSHYMVGIPGGWWKFDLPPLWREHWDSPLATRCLLQWQSAHLAVFDSKIERLHVPFEEFLQYPQAHMDIICQYLGLPPFAVKKMPVTMATEMPKQFRWRQRKRDILPLANNELVNQLMGAMKYSMEPETWI